MSLKAKLEAVIYAAEEPVTLAQLAMLFSNEALEWKAEQQAAARAADEAESSTAEPAELPLVVEAFAGKPEPLATEAETEQASVESPLPAGHGGEPAPAAEETETAAEDAAAEAEPAADPAQEAAAAEADARRAARQREREVRAILREALDEIIASCAADGRGVEIREIAGGYRMATKPECHDAVRLFVKSLKPPLKLSLPALETLAVIAYKQPVTAPEVNEVRGVDSSGVFGSLLARKLIATAGRKQVIGRPILYKTTKEFLLRFGLKDIAELPSMEEFEKMAAGELEEMEPAVDASTADAAGHPTPETGDSAPEAASPMPEIGDPAPESGENAGENASGETAAAASPPAETEPPATEKESNPSETAQVEAESNAD